MAMINGTLLLIGLPEIGFIAGIAVILFGCTAVLQNPFITPAKKLGWILIIILLNWIGLLGYYYEYYLKDKK